jgi:hypothetical protein
MLEHYQHISAGLVEEMAHRLGAGNGEVKAPPSAGSGRLVEAEAILALAESMTAKNWVVTRNEIMKLTQKKETLA